MGIPMNSTLLRTLLMTFVVVLSACTSVRTKTMADIGVDAAIGKGKTVVLLDADVRLSEILAGGVEEPRVEWSETAAALMRDGLQAEMKRRGVTLIEDAPKASHVESEGPANVANAVNDALATKDFEAVSNTHESERLQQVRRLASVVGMSVWMHGLIDREGLPTKKQRLEWTIGPGAKLLANHYKADYAMLTFVRDSYASSGTKALKVLGLATALAFGVGANVGTGQRLGYTLLIDLQTGNVVWANFLHSETGDMREAEGAQKVLASLLKGMPL
jgi:hypothetical protein